MNIFDVISYILRVKHKKVTKTSILPRKFMTLNHPIIKYLKDKWYKTT